MQSAGRIEKQLTAKNHWIILSPHLDDGVWSCGGLMWHAVRSGCRVDMVTVYTGNPPDREPPELQQRELTKNGSGLM